jgi:hypothetical protein
MHAAFASPVHAEHTANLDPNDKLRLFMCYCATHPEKLDATKRSHWATLARLHDSDMAAVCNLAFLGVPVMKPGRQSCCWCQGGYTIGYMCITQDVSGSHALQSLFLTDD